MSFDLGLFGLEMNRGANFSGFLPPTVLGGFMNLED